MNEEAPDRERPSLADSVIASARQVRGAPEHMEIADAIGGAERYILGDEVARALSETAVRRTASLERNIDLIALRTNPIWIEFRDECRRDGSAVLRQGADHPDRVGCLFIVDPRNHDRFVMIGAWDFPDGRPARHSYAMLNFDRVDMSNLALAARNRIAGDPAQSMERLLAQAHPYLPHGFQEEMHIVEPDPERALRDVAVDVISEAAFSLAAALFVTARLGVETPDPVVEHQYRVGMPPAVNNWLARFGGLGFRRSGDPRAPTLVYRPG